MNEKEKSSWLCTFFEAETQRAVRMCIYSEYTKSKGNLLQTQIDYFLFFHSQMEL